MLEKLYMYGLWLDWLKYPQLFKQLPWPSSQCSCIDILLLGIKWLRMILDLPTGLSLGSHFDRHFHAVIYDYPNFGTRFLVPVAYHSIFSYAGLRSVLYL